jgi:hypothetical protein
MKLFTGWVMSAGLALAATSANAQMLAPIEMPIAIAGSLVTTVSDVGGPYAEALLPGEGPRLLPGPEVYTVVRENGFSPLGIPQQRGYFYTIAVINRASEDGRLVIDARDGRIVRFVPAYRVGNNYDEGLPPAYGQAGPLPPMNPAMNRGLGVPRPPASVPHVASRTPSVPLPKAMPPRVDEPALAAKSDARFDNKPDAKSDRAAAPLPQSMAMQTKPVEMSKPVELSKSPQNTAPAPIDAKPAAPQIQPTQEMPKVQGLE